MRTIIDTRPKAFSLTAGASALLIWFGGMALAALIVTPQSVVAFGPPAQLMMAGAATDSKFINAGASFVTLQTGDSRAVRALYAAGAWLVWPAIGAGCRGRLAAN